MGNFTVQSLSGLRGFTAACGLPALSLFVLAAGAQLSWAQGPASNLSMEQVSRDSRGETVGARARYNRAKVAEAAHRDTEARDEYVSLLKSHPNMIEAVHDLAYLQATSTDSTVRDPEQAVFNAFRVIDMAEKRLVQRRKIRGAQNVLDPYNNIPLPASFYQVRMLNTMAVAYAAAGRFQPAGINAAQADQMAAGCGDEANADAVASMALEAARQTAVAHPSAENRDLLAWVELSHATIKARKGISGLQQPPPAAVAMQ